MRFRCSPTPLTRFRSANMASRGWQPPFAIAVGMLAACSPSGPATRDNAVSKPTSSAMMPDYLPDPLEPANRGLWAVNHGLLVGVLQPAGRAYRAVVPPPARDSIQHFTRNVTYPGRLINHALQGRWDGAGDESLRFLCNTTAGAAGFFDVASRWNIPRSDADFSQTFSRWGWNPGTFIMLPLLGPSDECHALGALADKAAEPWTYASPPYAYASYAGKFNRLSESTETASLFVRSEADPYAVMKYTWTYASTDDAPEWKTAGAPDVPTLQTLNVARITCDDQNFPLGGREMSVRLPGTGKNMKFNCWLQRGPAPLAYIAPGLGSHRLSLSPLSLAEHLYQNGFSVVTVSSIFHPEFMEQASTSALPAYPPADSRDLLEALTGIDRALERKHPGKTTSRALIGCSMGAYQALYLAAHEKEAPDGLLRFDRYVAIDTPVDLHHGINCIDRFHNAPLAWPADKRQEMVNNTIHKATKLAFMPRNSTDAIPPFDGTESKLLIGLTFRLVLRDAIFSSQSRNNQGIIKTPLSKWKREPVYQEILSHSYRDYFVKFVVPYYQSRGIGPADFAREANLRNHGKLLRGNPKVRAIINSNDFLLTAGDVSWMKSTFGPSRIKVFSGGGHLGNLASEPVQNAVIESLKGLK